MGARSSRRASRLLAATVAVALTASCSDDEGSVEALCSALRKDPSIATTFDGFDPTDVETALDQLRSARVKLGELRDAAPAEVKGDLSVEIDYVQALADALDGMAGRDAADIVATVQQVTADHADVDEAAANLAAFEESSCR
ncbi:MAG TPA: hypothetical protein VFV32_02460 [Acidimicrobiales bacterium]|nr:hypothetical protein [Acidimicrobiales bacterium]